MSDDLRDFLARARRGTAQAAKIIRLDELHHEERAEHEQPWSLAALRGRLVELSARGASGTLTSAASLVLEAQAEGEPVAWIVPWHDVHAIVDPLASGVAGKHVSLEHGASSGHASSEHASSSGRASSSGHASSGHASSAHGVSAPEATPLGVFYPPDAADSGIDLSALVVVRAPSVMAAGRAAERLLRSGAFGLIVMDLAAASLDVPGARITDAVLGRLVSLAQANDAAIVCLTEKASDAASLGSLVSLRVETLRARTSSGQSHGAINDYEVTVRALKDKRRGPGWTRAMKARGPSGL